MDFDALRHKIGFLFPLNHDRPLARRGGSRNADQDDREHQGEIGDTTVIPYMRDHAFRTLIGLSARARLIRDWDRLRNF